ncbi:MAG TPA: PH domain-containing protein [Polyangia bacterium]|nr:PH domain-containing protein [Polyangia bacterium]
MALLPCPECKQPVSDRASACPRCGLALSPAGPPAALAAGATPWTPPAPGAPAGQEEVLWQDGVSPRLLAREIPGLTWAIAAPPIAILVLPSALQIVRGLGHEIRKVIVENDRSIRLAVIGVVMVFSVIRLARVVLRYLQFKTTRYRLTNQRLTIESGLFSRRVDDVDLRSVQDVALEQSVLERLLGVGRLEIVSSDPTRPRLVLSGINDPLAVRERLRAGAYQASQRQVFTRST